MHRSPLIMCNSLVHPLLSAWETSYGTLHNLLSPFRITRACSGSPARVWVLARGWVRATSISLPPMKGTARAGRRSAASRATRTMETPRPRASTAFSPGEAICKNLPTYRAMFKYILWNNRAVFMLSIHWIFLYWNYVAGHYGWCWKVRWIYGSWFIVIVLHAILFVDIIFSHIIFHI